MVLLAVNFDNLHQILQSLYTDMMPLCSQMTGVAKGLAGLGALFYVAYRVWQSLARAEPIDVFPLLRPYALGICINVFSDHRAGYAQQHFVTRRDRNAQDSGDADL